MWLLDVNMPLRVLELLAEFQLRGRHFLDEFRREWSREPVRPVPGALIRWPGK